ncbi:hypothetical protein HELRODRAFT_170892 [Helobdella robusta]|uniref:Uncharacterized protein n=1 Tax=Helobdella robusta TaxID=6412 RepID=T1F3K4_HELRO|nr:hypothetical protein HELRODRAFT_170892 [Helobdella robusta]ESO06865.1 hypothetical protein HELRODRAFT_170892 [Helobdella robusta]
MPPRRLLQNVMALTRTTSLIAFSRRDYRKLYVDWNEQKNGSNTNSAKEKYPNVNNNKKKKKKKGKAKKSKKNKEKDEKGGSADKCPLIIHPGGCCKGYCCVPQFLVLNKLIDCLMEKANDCGTCCCNGCYCK